MKFWKQKDGKKIAIKDMADAHIINCIVMLQLRFEKECQENYLGILSAACSSSSDMGSYYAEQDLYSFSGDTQETVEDTFPIYRWLMKELEKRNKVKKK